MATPTPRPIPAKTPDARPTIAKLVAKPSRLAGIQRGRLKTPLRHLFYGPEGVGKSSLAADAPGVLLADIEGGSPELDVARYPFRDEDGGHIPQTYEDVLAMVDDLLATPRHGYQTLVLDTIDAVEALIHEYICRIHGKTGIEGFGYARGYKVALEEIRRLLARLDTLVMRGMSIILIGHSYVKTFKNPEGEDFDRYQLQIHDLAAGQIKKWCDVVGFVHFEGGSAKLVGDGAIGPRARGWATHRRIVQLAREAAWDAKSRLSLPAELELSIDHPWRPFAEAALVARDATVDSLIPDVIAEIDRIVDGHRELEFTTAAGTKTSFGAISAITAGSDATTLSRILAGLKATATISQEIP